MKKTFKRLSALVAVALVLVACGGGGGPTSDVGLKTQDNGRKYHAFALASTFNEIPSFYAYHSRSLNPWGVGEMSNNTARYASAEQDELLTFLRFSHPVNDALEYKENFLKFIKLWNEELPQLPMYANDIHDLYNSDNLADFETNPIWQWRYAIVGATSPSGTVTVSNTAGWNGEFMEGWGNSAYDNDIRTLVFGDGLIAIDQNGAPNPGDMVESYEANEDQTQWTFKLKEGVKFSNGDELTADDVIWTYLFYAHPALFEVSGGWNFDSLAEQYVGFEEFSAAMTADDYDPEATDEEGNPVHLQWDMSKVDAALANFEGFKKIDDYTVEFNYNAAEFSTWLGFKTVRILPKDVYFPGGDMDHEFVKTNLMSAPVGSGPFVFDEYVEGQFVKLSKNDLYVGNVYGEKASIDELIILQTAEETYIDQLLAGEVDLVTSEIDGARIDPVKDAEDQGFAWSNYDRHGYGHLTFHSDYDVTQFPEVKQAFAFGIDRQEFIDDFTGGYGVTVQGPYSLAFVVEDSEYDPTVAWHVKKSWIDENLTNYALDPEKAVQVMEDAGWVRGNNGKGLFEKEVDGEMMQAVIGIAAGTQGWADSLNLSTRNMEKDIGIKVIVEPIDFNVLLEHYYGYFEQ